MNAHNVKHPTFIRKLRIAIAQAVRTRRTVSVTNAKGKHALTVIYLTGNAAWSVIGSCSGFYCLDKHAKDVTALVLKAVKMVPPVIGINVDASTLLGTYKSLIDGFTLVMAVNAKLQEVSHHA